MAVTLATVLSGPLAADGAPGNRAARESFDHGAVLETEAAELLRQGDRKEAARRLSDALAAYKAALAEAPDDPDPALRIGTILLFKERCGEALPILERSARLAFDLDPARAGQLTAAQLAGRAKLRELLLLYGQCRLAKGPDTRGFATLEAVGDLKPEVSFFLGRRYLDAKKHKGALKHLSYYLRHKPGDLKTRIAVANIQLRLGQLADAAHSYRMILDRRPQDLNALKHLAVVEFRRKRYAAAVKTFRRVLKQSPGDVQSRFNLGVCLARIDRHREAVKEFRAALKRKPRLARAWHRLGVSLQALHRRREAIEALQAAVRHDSKHVSSYVALARLHRAANDHRQCASMLRRALEHESGDGKLMIELGDCVRDAGDLVGALAIHRRAVSKTDGSASAHAAVATDLEGLKRFPEAVDAYRRAVVKQPTDQQSSAALVRIQTRLGTSALKKRELKEAVRRLEDAVKFGPEHAVAHANLGLGLLAQRRLAPAERHLRRAVQLEGRAVDVRVALARLLLDQRRADEVVGLLASSSNLNGRGRHLLGLAYLWTGAVGNAVTQLERAASLYPKDRGLQVALGRALVRNRRYQEAMRVLESVESPGEVGSKRRRDFDLVKGYAAYRARRFEAATTVLASWESMKSRPVEALRFAAGQRWGLELVEDGRLNEARQAFKATVSKRDRKAQKTNVASVEYLLGRRKRAYGVWRGLAKHTAPAEVYYNIAIYLDDEEGKERAAYRWYRRYARKLPKPDRAAALAVLEKKRALFGFKP